MAKNEGKLKKLISSSYLQKPSQWKVLATIFIGVNGHLGKSSSMIVLKRLTKADKYYSVDDVKT
jgi:hypothetical protein